MRTLTRRNLVRAMTGAAIALPYGQLAARAEERWPARELHAVCGSPPGSGIDQFVRFYSEKLQDAVGRPVVVDTVLGASGNLATQTLARSAPDGLTLGILQGSVALAAAPFLSKTLPFDPINDFEHVALLSKLPFLLVVPGDSPFGTLADLTASLKTAGPRGAYGSTAVTAVVASALYKAQFGLETVEVKYADPAAALDDLYDRKITFMHVSAGFAHDLLRSGKLRALATSAADPTAATSGVPSAREAGILNSNLLSWWSIQAPKGTPRPIQQQLGRLFTRIAAADDTRAFLANAGSDPMPGGSDEARELLIQETKAWAGYAKLVDLLALGPASASR